MNYCYHDKTRGIYRITKRVNGKQKHFGCYTNKEEAELAVELFEKTGWNPEDNWAIKAKAKEILRNRRIENGSS